MSVVNYTGTNESMTLTTQSPTNHCRNGDVQWPSEIHHNTLMSAKIFFAGQHQVNQSNDQHASRLAIIIFGSNRTAGRYR